MKQDRFATYRRLGLVALAVPCLMSLWHGEAAHASQLRFRANVVERACNPVVDTFNQTVTFGRINANAAQSAGTVLAHGAFTLTLAECANADTISVSMTGEASAYDANLFAMNDEANGGGGVALAIHRTDDGAVQTPDGTVIDWTIDSPDMALAYQADVIRTDVSLVPGRVAGHADIGLDYK